MQPLHCQWEMAAKRKHAASTFHISVLSLSCTVLQYLSNRSVNRTVTGASTEGHGEHCHATDTGRSEQDYSQEEKGGPFTTSISGQQRSLSAIATELSTGPLKAKLGWWIRFPSTVLFPITLSISRKRKACFSKAECHFARSKTYIYVHKCSNSCLARASAYLPNTTVELSRLSFSNPGSESANFPDRVELLSILGSFILSLAQRRGGNSCVGKICGCTV